ncbi:MAG: NYN domain-containing protein [Candidatus Doudnabacteria bacterium]|nr:NYN domain-containing protein [Candidatus Doudnabacteria bacterium]
MKTYAFIDASNLFYGGEKSLRWKIDYRKLFEYLKNKYAVERVLYFGGVEIYGFKYDYLQNTTVPVAELANYLTSLVNTQAKYWTEAKLLLVDKHVQRVKFYLKLKKFGYELYLKPVKLYEQEDGTTKRKANCDVEMAFYLMKEKDSFTRAVILSGDGDFLPVLKYLRDSGKEIFVLSRGHCTAKEIRQFAGGNFRDFVRLETYIKFEDK